MNLYIYSYNNYYNRQVKKAGDNIDDYVSFLHYGPVQGVYGFTPGDGVNTTQLIGTNAMMYDGKGDYLIAHNPDTGEIDSRWFIVDVNRTRNGQWELTLHRDLIVDYYDIIINSPMYIEKATLTDDDPMIWNNEGISVNQIKTNEYTIQDDSKCAWIVGYLDRDFTGFTNDKGTDKQPITVTVSNPPFYAEYTEADYESLILSLNGFTATLSYQLVFAHNYIGQDTGRVLGTKLYALSSTDYKWTDTTGFGLFNVTPSTSSYVWYLGQDTIIDKALSKFSRQTNEKIMEAAKTYVPFIIPGLIEEFNNILSLNLKIIKVTNSEEGTEKFIRLHVKKESDYRVSSTFTTNLTKIDGIDALPTYLTQAIDSYIDIDGTVTGKIYDNQWHIVLTPEVIQTTEFEFQISEDRKHLIDAPYDLFCIPYKKDGLDIHLRILDDEDTDKDLTGKTLDQVTALSFAQDLARQLGSFLKDIQLLPYCPLQGWYNEDGIFKGNGFRYTKDFDYTQVTEDTLAIVFYSDSSQGTINSNQLHLIDTQTEEEHSMPLSLGNKKISNECDMYRLCSPNYNGQFEFNASKLNGITGFNADYTYLPYSPYIKLNPLFDGLYGTDFDDARGMIANGDFSISYLSDAWVNYQVLNKNYLNTFNRQIENMELKQGIERKQQVFNAVTGTIMGGTAGAVTGAKGGVAGAIAGAIVGTTASAIGGALDVQYGDILRNEALDYTKDMFNYLLENIQALPDSIAKVTAYTKNNKIFPILEYYTCTPTEKKAIANKIAWNGMTVMRIGTMSEFTDNKWSYGDITSKGYIKGKLIRLEFPVETELEHSERLIHSEDYRVVNAISGELDKGVYIL